LSTYIGKLQELQIQERKSESEKQLRLYEIQIEALKELSIIKYRVTPNIEPVERADLHEWLSPVVHDLNKIVNLLDTYLKDFSHISPSNVISHIHTAINVANDNMWNVSQSGERGGYEPSSKEIEGVQILIRELSSAVQEFKCSLGIAGS
jgi:hypothetical protein